MNDSHQPTTSPFHASSGPYRARTCGGRTSQDTLVSLVLVGAAAGLVGMSIGVLPFSWVVMVYVPMSLVTFALYAEDKRRSRRREWRIAELTLHKLELCGGWPGALLAQWYIRHKIAKTNYRRVTLAVAVLHCVAWVILWNRGFFPT